MNPVAEVRRERIVIPPQMTVQEIKQHYGFSPEKSRRIKEQGFFVRNYGRKQIIIDPENFDPAVSYGTAWKVLWKNFAWNSTALSIKMLSYLKSWQKETRRRVFGDINDEEMAARIYHLSTDSISHLAL